MVGLQQKPFQQPFFIVTSDSNANHEELIQRLTTQNSRLVEENRQLAEENRWLKVRLDVALNDLALTKELIQQLRDEIAVLKGQKPRPKIPPSTLEGPGKGDKEGGQGNSDKPGRGKHPRCNKSQLRIHATQRIKPQDLPPGAIFKGYQKFTVQDMTLQSHNTRYELERWQLPDGTYVNGQLPHNIQGHYGPQLVSYILYQYYSCRVTEPLILAQLKEIGILISAGQLSNILTQGKDRFHQEKEELLAAGIAATKQVQVDDTSARHRGKNGYSTILGNQYFTYIVSTESKSRINFFQILHGSTPRHLINEDTVDYIETLKPSHWLSRYLLLQARGRSMDPTEWKEFLGAINITSESDVRLATEATLFASLIANGIPRDLGVHGDDAGQFNAFVRSLCWIHEERHYRKLIPCDEKTRRALEQVRKEIWDLYRGLQIYKFTPSEDLKQALEKAFDDLFLKKKTDSPTLNNQLAKTYAKRAELLRVLERAATPLHNNSTETDAREMVVKRKISGSTRSAEGRRSRDTFVSLKKTCIKLGISFWSYLQDRTAQIFEIPMLGQVILTRSAQQPSGP